MKKLYTLWLAVLSLQFGCGEGTIDLTKHAQESYEPKIVIQGVLYPGQPARRIKISRNFPLATPIDFENIILKDAGVVLRSEDGDSRTLTYNFGSGYFADASNNPMVIDYGKSYTIEVSAVIDGQQVSTQATTTVPQRGFEILENESTLGSLKYRERDENDNLKLFNVKLNRSPGTDFYGMSIVALNADVSTYIWDNDFFEPDSEDVVDDLDDWQYQFQWIQDTPLVAGTSNIDIFWFFTWFYSDYRVVVYAFDKNYKDFLITHDQVQEIDGNFHEPEFHFEGDGIGVFGSAIADTVQITVLRR
jgi:hypothetical protein